MTKSPRMIAAIALMTLTAVALTGCLVKKKEPEPPYYRKSDNLRVYKQGDWIRYNVFATTTAGPSIGDFRSGILEVQWGNYSPLTSPDGNVSNGGEPYDVIEKRYLFCLNDAAGTPCIPTETRVIQYIHQDDPKSDPNITLATAGTERLVAMGGHPNFSPSQPQYYWLNTTGGRSSAPANPDNDIIGGQEPVITLKSPLFINDVYTVEYFLMDGCVIGVTNCQSDVGRFTNSIKVVGDSTQINTNIGNYANPLEINFNGKVIPDVNVGDTLPITFDIFDLCTYKQSEHSGRIYIVPEIGAIQMKITCKDSISGNAILYDITVDSISSSILAGT